ncbi:MAG: transglycosylase SLT domain-containing protein [Oligoflexus sp.]
MSKSVLMVMKLKLRGIRAVWTSLMCLGSAFLTTDHLSAKSRFEAEVVQQLLREARSTQMNSLKIIDHEFENVMDFDKWISLSRQADLAEQIDAPNLRLTSQLMALESFSQEQRSASQMLFQAMNFEFYQDSARVLSVLDNIDPKLLNKDQRTTWYQLKLRALIKQKKRQEAHDLLSEIRKRKAEVLLTFDSYLDAINLLQDVSAKEQMQFYVEMVDKHPNRRILKDAYRRMMTTDFKTFSFHYLFLRRLALSRDIVDGMQNWLAQVFENGQIHRYRRYDSDYLRLMLLMRINELDKAENIAKKLVEKNENNRKKHLEFSQTLGQIFERLNRSGESFNLYSDLLERYGRNRDTRYIWENYARLLGEASSFSDAAREYGGLTRIDPRRTIRWFYFWNLYRAERYQDALALIENNIRAQNYSRDEREPLGIFYWQARIYEKLGREKEALQIHRRILKNDGASFYATMIVGQTRVDGKKIRYVLRSELAKSGEAKDEQEITSSQINLAEIPELSYDDWRRERQKNNYPRLSISDFSSLLASQIDNRSHWMQTYPLMDFEWMRKVSKVFDVDPLVLASIIRAESFYNPEAVSPVGAQGLMQIMPYTALKISQELNDPSFNFNELRNPRMSVIYGAYYIRKLLDYFGNNLVLALASYNAGPFKTLEWVGKCGMCDADEFVESITYLETRRYVKSILAHYAHYKRIYRHEMSPNMATRLPAEFAQGAVIY